MPRHSGDQLLIIGMVLAAIIFITIMYTAGGAERSYNECVTKAAHPELCRK